MADDDHLFDEHLSTFALEEAGPNDSVLVHTFESAAAAAAASEPPSETATGTLRRQEFDQAEAASPKILTVGQRPSSSSRFKGVTLNRARGKWVVQANIGTKRFYGGLFKTEVGSLLKTKDLDE